RSLLLLLGAVAAASLLAAPDTLGVEGAAHDLVADAGKVLHSATAHEHDGVLLQVVADARDVGRDLDARGQPHTGDLAQGGVRLLGGGRVHAGAHAAALRRALEGRGGDLRRLVLPALAHQLVDGRQPDLRTCGDVVSGRPGPPGRSSLDAAAALRHRTTCGRCSPLHSLPGPPRVPAGRPARGGGEPTRPSFVRATAQPYHARWSTIPGRGGAPQIDGGGAAALRRGARRRRRTGRARPSRPARPAAAAPGGPPPTVPVSRCRARRPARSRRSRSTPGRPAAR